MKIALDAMGGDFAPAEIVQGAVTAAKTLPSVTKIILVGDEKAIKNELTHSKSSVLSKLEIFHASEVIGMDEAPAKAVRSKKDSSINRAVELVKAGEEDEFLSDGNTGAAMVASTLRLRALKGIERPAIATAFPTLQDPMVLIDAGANMDCSAKQLFQFAIMGAQYSKLILGKKDPVVGLLSIGGEDSKGNEITKEAFRMLSNSNLNFKGNVEGHDLFHGDIDVITCDGFVGNVVLKTCESTAKAVTDWIKLETKKSPFRILGALMMRGAFHAVKKHVDAEQHGGAPLLGVNGVSIITHGSTSRRGIVNAIRVASESIHNHLNDAIENEIAVNQNIGKI
jgi:glycerol-3-phosphate acyltransferase PlsX